MRENAFNNDHAFMGKVEWIGQRLEKVAVHLFKDKKGNAAVSFDRKEAGETMVGGYDGANKLELCWSTIS